MDDGLGGSFRMLLSAVEGAMNAIAKALEGTLKPFVDRATEATLAIIKWIEANSGLVTGFALAVAGAARLGSTVDRKAGKPDGGRETGSPCQHVFRGMQPVL